LRQGIHPGSLPQSFKTPGHLILDKAGNLDHSIQVVINDRDYVKAQDFEKGLLKDGDSVTFMMLIAGG
jgi:sulfur carrier protein ThiS